MKVIVKTLEVIHVQIGSKSVDEEGMSHRNVKCGVQEDSQLADLLALSDKQMYVVDTASPERLQLGA